MKSIETIMETIKITRIESMKELERGVSYKWYRNVSVEDTLKEHLRKSNPVPDEILVSEKEGHFIKIKDGNNGKNAE